MTNPQQPNEFNLDTTEFTKPARSPVGIVDADSIMFNLGWYFEKADLLVPGDYSKAKEAPEFVYKAAKTFVTKLKEQMHVDNIHLHFTGGSKNQALFEEFMGRGMNTQFRQHLGNAYKDNRKAAPLPTGYHYTLRALLNEPYAYIHDTWEADEAVILHKKLNPTWVMSSNDKDVYKQHHGENWLYDKRRKWVDISKADANYFAFFQAITGDPVDGFIGVPGIGPKKAVEYVSPDKTPGDNWQGVLDAFASKGLDEREALINMRFASMSQLVINDQGQPEVDIWKPEGHHLEPVWK